ncbi:hypothetical protein HDK77DRAFT_229954 [Phyllosticta capitalensis]
MQSKTRRCHARSVTVQKAASHPGIQALCIRKRSAALAVDSVAMFEVGKWSATSLLFLCLVARTVHMAPPPARPSSITGNQSSCFDSLRRLKLLECCFCRMVSLFDVLPASAVMPKMGNQQSPSTRSRRLKLSSSGHCSYFRLVSVVSPFLSFLLPFNALSSPFYPHFFIIHRHATTITINTCVPSSPTPKDHTHTPARPTNSKMPYPPKAYSARRPSVDRSRASRGRLRKRFRPMAPPQTSDHPHPPSATLPTRTCAVRRASRSEPVVWVRPGRQITEITDQLLLSLSLAENPTMRAFDASLFGERLCVLCVWLLIAGWATRCCKRDAGAGLFVCLFACLLPFRACALSCPVPRLPSCLPACAFLAVGDGHGGG